MNGNYFLDSVANYLLLSWKLPISTNATRSLPNHLPRWRCSFPSCPAPSTGCSAAKWAVGARSWPHPRGRTSCRPSRLEIPLPVLCSTKPACRSDAGPVARTAGGGGVHSGWSDEDNWVWGELGSWVGHTYHLLHRNTVGTSAGAVVALLLNVALGALPWHVGRGRTSAAAFGHGRFRSRRHTRVAAAGFRHYKVTRNSIVVAHSSTRYLWGGDAGRFFKADVATVGHTQWVFRVTFCASSWFI